MSRLPKGALISEVSSPKGTYTLKAYVSSGGATADYAFLGELNFNKENRKPKNVMLHSPSHRASLVSLQDFCQTKNALILLGLTHPLARF
ncbi:DUF5412 family protein [Neobacillus terrae]|uniref:DUF5412 family protein n=1 Tax=Neobacillus terrae TaxID=3034837 RepID=UPI001A9C752A